MSRGSEITVSEGYTCSFSLLHYPQWLRNRNNLCLLTTEQMKKMCVCMYTHIHEHITQPWERRKPVIVTTWIKLEDMLSEISQTEKKQHAVTEKWSL
jgi:hypothetical protein